MSAFSAGQWVMSDLVANGQMASRITRSEDGLTYYIAYAEPGVAHSAARWQIKKVVESAATGAATIVTTWADGDNCFDNVATDPTALTYA